MSRDPNAADQKLLVVHHDSIVLEDLREAIGEMTGGAVVHHALELSPTCFLDMRFDAALIEVSRNARLFETAPGDWVASLGRIIWITDNADRRPDTPRAIAQLEQPFRTDDIAHVLKTAGVLSRIRPAPSV